MKEVQSLDKPTLKKTGQGSGALIKRSALAFIAAALCFICMLAVGRKYPLGSLTIVISDLEGQYAPYLFLLRSKLMDLDFGRFLSDFGYSFGLGAGKNFAGTFGYYLASPLNLLVLLFKPEQTNEFITLLMLLKLSFSSAFMCMFIEERAEFKGTYRPVLWGILYAFSSYTMLFLFHIMWLDGYMLLPLLLFMIERYLKNGKLGGVTAVLLVLFLSNYYIAYMAGIYSFIYLLARMYLTGRFDKSSRPGIVIGRFVLRAVMAGLALGVMLIPVGLDTIRNGDPTASASSESSYVGFTFGKFLDRIFLGYPGYFNDVLISNMPLIFVSLIVTLLCIVYFVSKAFAGKEKKLYAAAFILIYAVLCVDFLDVAWQVFDSPNWFWHREAFVFIPLFLTVSYKVYENLSLVSKSDILKSAGILAVLLLAAQCLGQMATEEKVFLYNAVIIAVYALFLIGLKKDDWSGQLQNVGRILGFFLPVIIVYETVFLSSVLSSGTSTLSLNAGGIEPYKSAIASFETYARKADEISLEGSGFRSDYESMYMEEATPVSGTEQYAGYRGITLFNSDSNKMFTRFLKQLGYTVNYNYFWIDHSYSAPDTDAFFSIGSIYSSADDYKGADLIGSDDNISFMRTRSVLPLAFTALRGARDFDFYSLETDAGDKDYFALQDDWYRSLFPGFTEDFYIPADDGAITEELINASVIDMNEYRTSGVAPAGNLQTDEDESDAFDADVIGLEDDKLYTDALTAVYRTNSKLPIILNYDVEIERDDELYMNISVPRCNGGCEVYLNGRIIASLSDNSFFSTVLRLGAYEPGDTVRVTIMSGHDVWEYLSVNFAYFGLGTFESQFGTIDTDAVTVTETDDGYVAFTADVKAGEMILTSIPYEDGWSVTVDGVPSSVIPYQDALISIDAEPGTHEVVLKFTPPGVKAGAAVSVFGIAGLIAAAIIDNKKKNWNNVSVKNEKAAINNEGEN